MKLPRDLSGEDLIKRLERLGYRLTRQVGSHVRLTTAEAGEHHLTTPKHDPLRTGTLQSILREVERHHGLTRRELLGRLFGS